MSFKVQVGPHQVSIHQGQTVLVSEPDGQIKWPSDKGLYFFDTRVISNWAIYANGEPWDLLNGGAITRRVKKLKRQRSRRVKQGWHSGAGGCPVEFWGRSTTPFAEGRDRGRIWIGRASWPT